MSWLKQSVAEALRGQRETLGEIFGSEYSIDSIDSDRAVVRSRKLQWHIWFDRRRDRSVGSALDLGVGESWHYKAPLETLARFLGEEELRLVPRNASGIVASNLEEQIASELKLLRRLGALADPLVARDAAFFVHGYNRAYTDYATGKWEVS